jgi:hypothetical protein
MKRLLSLVPVIAALAAGCGNVPEAKDYNDALVAVGVAECACGAHVLFGAESEAECQAEHPPSEGEQACVEALFKSLDPDFGPHLECRTAAENRYASCLSSKTCSDLARAGCLGERIDELEDCPALPDDVQKELNECLN